jgi:hypothetical protein
MTNNLMNFIHNNTDIIKYFNNHMTLTTPTFVGRIGGSDFEIVCDYHNNPNIINDPAWYNRSVRKVRELNGYFDFSNSKDNFQQYLKVLIDGYLSSDVLSYGGKMEKYVRFYINGKSDFDSRFKSFVWQIGTNKSLINYNEFIQSVRPFLESFKVWGADKKILIVSPLSKSIEHQYLYRDNLFLDYKYPNFELKTFNTSITYNDSNDNMDSLKIETNNWHEECDRIANGISTIDFDIALLSCGSYSMFLGNYIKTKLKKKAIYFGGSLNLYFNIYGKRFDPLYNRVGLNPKYLINAFENADIENISGGRLYHNESLQAYFGKKL